MSMGAGTVGHSIDFLAAWCSANIEKVRLRWMKRGGRVRIPGNSGTKTSKC